MSAPAPDGPEVRPWLGVVPALLCLVLACALGAWGWQERDEARARVRAEREARDGPDEPFDIDGPSGTDVTLIDACGRLFLAATLTPPSTVGAAPGQTTVAATGDDLARELIALLDDRPDAGVPALESSEVQAAIGRLRVELGHAVDRSDDPLAEPGVVAASADLDAALLAVC